MAGVTMHVETRGSGVMASPSMRMMMSALSLVVRLKLKIFATRAEALRHLRQVGS
jgi:hypothetical protein